MTEDQIAQIEPRLDLYIREREQAKAYLDELRVSIGEQNPRWQAAKMALDLKQHAVDDFVARWRKAAIANPPSAMLPEDQVLATRTVLQNRLAELNRELDKLDREADDLGERITKVERLRHDEQANAAELDTVRKLISDLDTESKNQPRILVAEKAETPLIVKDLRLQAACAGGVAGFLMGFIIVLTFVAADRRYRSPHDMRGGAKRLALLGVLPSLPDDLADPDQAAIAAHCVHQIRTLLQIGAASPGHQVFAITSPAAGTGKTSLTLSLGVSFAAANSKTLIVDCDLIGGGLTVRVDAIIRRKVGQILRHQGLVTQQQLETAIRVAQASQKKLGEVLVELGYLTADDVQQALSLQDQLPVGMLDALAGEKLEDCIAQTGIQNLSILPLGAARPGDISKLSPATVRALLARAREQFDTIIIDTGPVPGSLEASVVAAAADGVVLVVSRGEHRPLAERSIQHLTDIGAHVSGVVFNRAQYRDLDLSATNTRVSSLARSTRDSVPQGQSGRFGPVAQAVADGDLDAGNPVKPQS